jgi:hypothetical protein
VVSRKKRLWGLAAAVLLAAGAWTLWPRHPAPRPAAAPAEVAPPPRPPPPAPPSKSRPDAPPVRLGWGAGKGQLGHRRDAESAAEGPMSLVAGRGGDTWVLDQVNGRAVRLDAAGRVVAEVRVSESAQDLAVGAGGNLYVLDRVGAAEVSVYDAAGAPITTDAVVGGPIREGGAVTGIFVDDEGVYLEREHTDAVRVRGPDGRFDPERPVVPGRPARDGSAYVRVALTARRAKTVTLTAFERDGAQRWQRRLELPHGVLNLVLLDTDLAGHVLVGANVADEAITPPYQLLHQATVVLRVALADGADRGSLELPMADVPEEIFRPLAVTDEGTVLQLLPSTAGVELRAWRFP